MAGGHPPIARRPTTETIEATGAPAPCLTFGFDPVQLRDTFSVRDSGKPDPASRRSPGQLSRTVSRALRTSKPPRDEPVSGWQTQTQTQTTNSMGLRVLPEEFAELLAVIVGHAHLPRVLMHRLDHAGVPLPDAHAYIRTTAATPLVNNNASACTRSTETPSCKRRRMGQSPVLLPEGGEFAADVSLLADRHQRRVPRRRTSSPCHTQPECAENPGPAAFGFCALFGAAFVRSAAQQKSREPYLFLRHRLSPGRHRAAFAHRPLLSHHALQPPATRRTFSVRMIF